MIPCRNAWKVAVYFQKLSEFVYLFCPVYALSWECAFKEAQTSETTI